MNKQHLDTGLLELRRLDTEIAALDAQRSEIRREIFGTIEDEGLTDGYKNDFATVCYVERKTVLIKDQPTLLTDLQKRGLDKYVEEIPARLDVTPAFAKDVKDGKFSHGAVEVKTSTSLAVRFAEAA